MEPIDRVKIALYKLIDDAKKRGDDVYHRVRSDVRNGLFAAVAGKVEGPDDDVWLSDKGARISQLIDAARRARPIPGENHFIYLLMSVFEGLWEKKAWQKAIEWAEENPEGIPQAVQVDLRLQEQEAPAPDPEEMEDAETLYEDEENAEFAALGMGVREEVPVEAPGAQQDIVAPPLDIQEGDMVDEPPKGGKRRRTKKAKKTAKKSKKVSKKTRRR